ncbi:hypothetical protein U0070_026999, partial [Myodes glareolus]
DPENPTKSCKLRDSNLRVHFKNVCKTAQAIEVYSCIVVQSVCAPRSNSRAAHRADGPKKVLNFCCTCLKTQTVMLNFKGLTFPRRPRIMPVSQDGWEGRLLTGTYYMSVIETGTQIRQEESNQMKYPLAFLIEAVCSAPALKMHVSVSVLCEAATQELPTTAPLIAFLKQLETKATPAVLVTGGRRTPRGCGAHETRSQGSAGVYHGNGTSGTFGTPEQGTNTPQAFRAVHHMEPTEEVEGDTLIVRWTGSPPPNYVAHANGARTNETGELRGQQTSEKHAEERVQFSVTISLQEQTTSRDSDNDDTGLQGKETSGVEHPDTSNFRGLC